MVEISTAGITISTELRKYGASPLHSTPMHASDQASVQASKVMSWGSASRDPVRISSMSFNDVASITAKGRI